MRELLLQLKRYVCPTIAGITEPAGTRSRDTLGPDTNFSTGVCLQTPHPCSQMTDAVCGAWAGAVIGARHGSIV